MKKSIFSAAMVFSLVVSAPLMAAASSVNPGTVIGQVSVIGAGTLDQAEQMLNNKARAMGGDAIHITSMGGKNKLFATAEVLKN
ncbi:YdgH/BhsA/McbA-like domain containing protein [Pantoea rwandensis]|uniref:YdgH/BhsA/McbA-like domain-containing protein n=1 Tax=Pantoea rwandensis TaxID=1076550 RepID=A0A1X1D5G2_9GAMM|nr:YdgH/BhsA/McbA-like domain containing protein [Pantoea rwandensis]ORM71867.1 hypothetical protein HA51_02035 [Pantoea rwandensis]